jgi:hypothetical protein
MNTYKITNITNLAGKRDFKFNSDLDIEFVDNMVKKSIKVKPNESVYLSVSSLPLSVHRLRVKGLVTVTEVGEKELAEVLAKSNKPKENKKPESKKQSTPEKEAPKKTYGGKKKTTGKSKQKDELIESDIDSIDSDEVN